MLYDFKYEQIFVLCIPMDYRENRFLKNLNVKMQSCGRAEKYKILHTVEPHYNEHGF